MRGRFTVPALVIALSFANGACELDGVTDTNRPVAGKGDAALSKNGQFDPAGGLTAADLEPDSKQISEARRRIVASLPLQDLGRIDIVDGGLDGKPWYVYFSVGGGAVHDVLDQLVEQDATPAEVFLTLAPRETAVPESLIRDHRERFARGETKYAAPRRLKYDLTRVPVERIELDCWSGGEADEPLSFASWIDDFFDWSQGYVDWNTHGEYNTTAEFPKYGWIPARNRRAMSVCDASHHTGGWASDPEVTFAGLGYHFPYTIVPTYFYVADDLSEYESVRFKSSDGPFASYFILVDQSYPEPRRAYIAFGSCDLCVF